MGIKKIIFNFENKYLTKGLILPVTLMLVNKLVLITV